MIEIKIDNRKVLDALQNLQQRACDLSPAMLEIGAHIESEVALNFRDASDPYGNAWEPLKHRQGTPLNDTGILKNSITYNASSDSVEIGTNVEYAVTHQKGATKGQYRNSPPIPWGNVPARPFLPTEEQGLPSAWEEDVLCIISNHLESAI